MAFLPITPWRLKFWSQIQRFKPPRNHREKVAPCCYTQDPTGHMYDTENQLEHTFFNTSLPLFTPTKQPNCSHQQTTTWNCSHQTTTRNCSHKTTTRNSSQEQTPVHSAEFGLYRNRTFSHNLQIDQIKIFSSVQTCARIIRRRLAVPIVTHFIATKRSRPRTAHIWQFASIRRRRKRGGVVDKRSCKETVVRCFFFTHNPVCRGRRCRPEHTAAVLFPLKHARKMGVRTAVTVMVCL